MAFVVGNTAASTRKIVRQLYTDYARDLDRAIQAMSEDFKWSLRAPADLLGVPPIRSQRAAFKEFSAFRQRFEILGVDAKSVLADGNEACIEAQIVFRNRLTGFGSAMMICGLVKLSAERKVASVVEFLDSLTLQNHLAGII